MPFVIYAAPNYTPAATTFIDKLASIPNVQLGLICQEPVSWLRQETSSKLAAFAQVENAFDGNQLLAAARQLLAQRGNIHRIIGATEQIQIPVAEVREALGIPGMGVETMKNFRDKARMKDLLRKAGVPCAKHALAASVKDALAFAKKTGYPIVVKPPDGAASQATYRANNEQELEAAVLKNNPSPGKEVLLEEFIQADEFSFDTFSLNGKPLFHSISHYLPNPLEVLREPWIQWQVLIPREVDEPQYDDIRQAAFKTLETLGMETGMTHLEWFRRKDGSIAISEVAARPPGAQITTLISRAADFDCVSAWGRLMIFGEFEVPQRKYAVGAAYLRGQGEGKVVAVHGLEQVNAEVGHLITDARTPQIGQQKGATYEGEGFIILRHPDTEVVREALGKVVSTVQVILG
ncbi:MAG: ATP-grasp domain-containing protein [Lewinellaceae bacterium]|nr:ATP-grasp domain-containing protein [Lewinellaceae bacterium]